MIHFEAVEEPDVYSIYFLRVVTAFLPSFLSLLPFHTVARLDSTRLGAEID